MSSSSYGNNSQRYTLKQNESQNFEVGDSVSHAKFGEGKVVQVDKTTDMIVIEFAGIGRKILSIK
jgi:hypothetical protein